MDLFLEQLRAAYRRSPGVFIAFILVAAIIGVALGYRFVGPALFG